MPSAENLSFCGEPGLELLGDESRQNGPMISNDIPPYLNNYENPRNMSNSEYWRLRLVLGDTKEEAETDVEPVFISCLRTWDTRRLWKRACNNSRKLWHMLARSGRELDLSLKNAWSPYSCI